MFVQIQFNHITTKNFKLYSLVQSLHFFTHAPSMQNSQRQNMVKLYSIKHRRFNLRFFCCSVYLGLIIVITSKLKNSLIFGNVIYIIVSPHCPAFTPTWESWGQWSQCTLTCDGGTSTRTRTCSLVNSTEPVSSCNGEYKQINVCNFLPCPGNYHLNFNEQNI